MDLRRIFDRVNQNRPQVETQLYGCSVDALQHTGFESRIDPAVRHQTRPTPMTGSVARFEALPHAVRRDDSFDEEQLLQCLGQDLGLGEGCVFNVRLFGMRMGMRVCRVSAHIASNQCSKMSTITVSCELPR
jgi:hypothetical protein